MNVYDNVNSSCIKQAEQASHMYAVRTYFCSLSQLSLRSRTRAHLDNTVVTDGRRRIGRCTENDVSDGVETNNSLIKIFIKHIPHWIQRDWGCVCFSKKTKSTGLDDISARLLKECCSRIIAPTLTDIFNQSLKSSIFPRSGKTENYHQYSSLAIALIFMLGGWRKGAHQALFYLTPGLIYFRQNTCRPPPSTPSPKCFLRGTRERKGAQIFEFAPPQSDIARYGPAALAFFTDTIFLKILTTVLSLPLFHYQYLHIR
jgi:hypothetical protein